MKLFKIYSMFIFFVAIGAGRIYAGDTIVLATTEREPYIGKNLLNQGYVYELVSEAFSQMDHNVKFKYFPLARAIKETIKGSTDGIAPFSFDKKRLNDFVFSDPFPGDNLVILKKKSSKISIPGGSIENLSDILNSLKKYKVGIVRGSTVAAEFDKVQVVGKTLLVKDIQSIDMLAAGRVDLIIIDKFSAADLLTKERPHLIGELEFTPPALVSNPFHVAFLKKSKRGEQFKTIFNLGLKALQKNGRLAAIQAKHGLFFSPAKANKKIKLTIATVNNREMSIMQNLSKVYEKSHPNIQLEWQLTDENTMRTRLLSGLAVNEGQFDIMSIGAFEAPIWAKNKWITPLSEFPEEYDVSDLLKPIRESLSYDGKLYALPFYGESSMTYYRKDLFKAAGIKMPKSPTYADILKFAKKIHNPQKKIYGICLRGMPGWGANISYFTTLVNTFGGRWFDENWNAEIESPEWRKALSLYKRLLTQYGPPNVTSQSFNEIKELFSSGHCGMWVDATVAAGMLFDSKQSKVHDVVGFASAPIAKTKTGSQWLWTWALAVSSTSKFPNEAFEFIRWATSKEYIKLVAKRDGWISVPPGTRQSTYDNKNYQSVAPFADFILSAIKNASSINNTLMPSPYHGIQFVEIPEFPSLGLKVGLEISKTLKGEISIDKALTNGQAIVSNQMQRSGYTKKKKLQ